MLDQLSLPTFEQVVRLPALISATVKPEWIDANGHMNIRHYLDLGSHTSMVGTETCGVNQEYRDHRRMGLFTAENHLTYLSEMHLGEELTGHLRVVDLGSKSVHIVALLLDREHNKLANIFESLLVHVNMDTRRAVDMPSEVFAEFEAKVAEDKLIDWPAPLSGSMAVRR